MKLIIKHLGIYSYFLIRLRVDGSQNEEKYMKTHVEFVDIILKSNRTQNFRNKEIKKEAVKIQAPTNEKR